MAQATVARRSSDSAGLVEKFSAKPSWLRQGDGPGHEAGDDDSRKACARTNVDPRRASVGLVPDELRRIKNVTLPNFLESRGRDQVLTPVFLAQEGDVALQPFNRFT